MEIALLVLVLAFTVASFAFQWLPIDVTALTSLALLLLFDLVSTEDAVAGFANPAVVTVMMMFVLSEGLVQSGVLTRIGAQITHLAGRSGRRASVILLLLAGSLSAFINNTAAIALFMPVALVIAKRYRFSPSKILLPLSYAAIVGGSCTLIGTSTNLVVSALARQAGLPAFTVFEFLAFGGILFVVGITYNVLIAIPWLAPRAGVSDLTSKYSLSAYLTEVRVPEGSRLEGQTVLGEGVSERFNLNVLEILRGKRKIAQDIRNTEIAAADVLLVRGDMEDILALREHYGLLLLPDVKMADVDLADESNVMAEMQLSPSSRLAGQTLKEVDFRKTYGAFVLAINRTGQVIRDKVAFIALEPWDILLVFGPRTRIQGMSQQEDFLTLGEVDLRLRLARRWWIAAAVIPLVVLLAASGMMDILKAAILGVVLLLVTGTLTIQRAYRAIDWRVIFLLAAVLPLGLAMQSTGLAARIGTTLGNLGAPYGPVAVLGLIVVTTALLTEVISNNSAAVLMVPIAISVAAAIDVDPKPLLMGVAFAASMSFMTPIGYQTNTMVYGPGAYRFSDYLRTGAPLALTAWVLATLLIPRIWGF
ncbi:MAG TPA: SLC13 family permease [Thermoanaerobaculia bacterium]|nr:SLC13 family permease [Thermoanaerobaculia bacterium]